MPQSSVFRVGNFQPSRFEEDVIRSEFAEFLRGAGYVPLVPPEVRTPAFNSTSAPHVPTSKLRTWHTDGGNYPEGIYWSNELPTEVRGVPPFADGDAIYIPLSVEHRYPEAAINSKTRWFARLYHFERRIA